MVIPMAVVEVMVAVEVEAVGTVVVGVEVGEGRGAWVIQKL